MTPDARSVDPAPPAEVLAAAWAARDNAYAPYSHFHVGAALWTRDARIVAGCNVENASYGLTLCAERGAFASAIAQGVAPGRFAGLVVVGDTPGPISPCGACRQVMLELGGPELPVWLCNAQGAVRATTAAELLPDGFVVQDLHPDAGPR